jgi:transcriptional regulator with XRE-family HTH domain
MVSHAHWKIARDRKVAQGIAEDPATEKLRAGIALRYDVGQAVYDRRTECGISQTELARRAGMSQPQVSKLEIGGTLPTVALLARLARAMDAAFSLEVDGDGFQVAFTARPDAAADPAPAAAEATDAGADADAGTKQAATG